LQLGRQHQHNFPRSLIYIHRRSVETPSRKQRPKPLDDLSGALRISNDALSSGLGSFGIGWIGRQQSQTRVGVGEDAGQRLIHFMRY
jgi:hypothetical protein